MKVLELFAGTRSIGKAFESKGHEVYSVEWNKDFENIDLYGDIGELTAEQILKNFGKPDVIWASPDCFVKGNLVWTSQGYKNIEDIKCNDYVLTHNGKYKKVYRTMKQSKTHMCEVRISGSETIMCTTNHPFYARKKHYINTHKSVEPISYTELLKPEWIKAEDLSNEYKVGIPINTNSIVPKWNGVVISRANQNGVYESHIVNTLNQYMDNEKFWWLIGRYFGDGSLSSNKCLVDICCAIDEINEIKPVLDDLKIRYTERTQDIHHFIISSKEWCEFLRQFGVGALNKTITPLILDLPQLLLKSFIDGYISADGHWDNSLQNPKCIITTISKGLAYGMQFCLLKAYGRYCSMVTRENQNNIICGRKVNVHKLYILNFYKNISNRTKFIIEDNMAWINVRDVKILPTKQTTTYNLSVEDDESYTINNIAVHNCTTFSIAAISHHRRKNEETGNLDPVSDYAKFCDKVDQHVLDLIKELNPKFWFIENPRGGMRKMSWMQGLPRYTVTYCKYGDTRMKPTDIWTNHPNPRFLPMCKNGDSCHESAPRGSKTGTQGRKGSVERSKIPDKLCEHIVKICEDYITREGQL